MQPILIDTDHDGRIKVPEIIAAVKWAGAMLKNPDELIKGSPSLPLDAINDSTEVGRQLLASAKQILQSLGKPGISQAKADQFFAEAQVSRPPRRSSKRHVASSSGGVSR